MTPREAAEEILGQPSARAEQIIAQCCADALAEQAAKFACAILDTDTPGNPPSLVELCLREPKRARMYLREERAVEDDSQN